MSYLNNKKNHARQLLGLALATTMLAILFAGASYSVTRPSSSPKPAGLTSAQVTASSRASTGSLNTKRYGHAATLLPDDQALLAGGWTSIGTNPAGVAASIVADPNGTGILFIGSAGGGVRKSTDNGHTWSTVNTGLTTLVVSALAMDPSGPQIVYAGTGADGVFKTTDGGATWQKLVGMAGTIINYLAVDPNRPTVVYAGLVGGAIRKTSDGGATWTPIFAGTTPIPSIIIDPRNSDVVYIASVGGGAFKSVNAGQSWSPMSALTPRAIFSLALDHADSRVLYAGTNEDGVWRTTDAGTTWQRQGAPSSPVVLSLAVDPSLRNTVYAGTAGGGVWQSFDDGSSWQPTGLSSGMALSLAMDPTRVLYAGTDFAGAQVSYDLGTTWTSLDPGLGGANGWGFSLAIDPANHEKIIVGTNWSGLIASPDGGATWAVAGQGFSSLSARQLVFDPTNSQRIYAGSYFGGGLFKSEDGGLHWSRRRIGSASVYMWAPAVSASSPNVIYAGTFGEGLFKSTDYGDTWTATGSGLPPQVQGLTLDPSNNNRLFAATPQGLYRSEDSGATWTRVLNKPAWATTIDTNVASTIYVTTRTEGVQRSLDGGSTWQDSSTGLTTPSSRTMGRSAPVIIDPTNPQTLYVGGEGGVFNSHDGGAHWSAVNSGLSNLSVWGLAMDQTNPVILYACGPSGVYKTLTGGAPTPNPTDDAEFFVRQHYLDFLGREPDAGGLAYWTDRITQCGSDSRCIHERRIAVSAAFFMEQEFQETGYYVYRFYKASFGRQPNNAEFIADRSHVIGGSSLEANKQAFADEWVQRAAFLDAYPITMSNAEVVNKLFDSAGLTASTYDPLRQQEILAMNAGRSRALVFRDVIEIPDFKNVPEAANRGTSQYNPAFVLMQYFGYLQRQMDQGGYDFWLDIVNNRQPNNYLGMVCSFITSAEYQLRFGSTVTRSNADCGQ